MPDRLLVTGSAGVLGAAVIEQLRGEDVEIVPFDIKSGNDILDLDDLIRSTSGCAAIVHLAAIPTDVPGQQREIGSSNVLGVWNVALAAERAGVGRIVFSSSVNALGVFMGQGVPQQFPIDDRHPASPVTPYSVAKLAAEEIFAALSRRSGITTCCLRLPALLDEVRSHELLARWSQGLPHELTPYWEYGACLDLRDAARAVVAATRVRLPLHSRVMLTDSEPAHVAPMLALIDEAVPRELQAQAKRALERTGVLVDSDRGWAMLGIEPIHHWSSE